MASREQKMHRPCKEEYLGPEDQYRSPAVMGMDGHHGQRAERHRSERDVSFGTYKLGGEFVFVPEALGS